jgi:hypothetical protein
MPASNHWRVASALHVRWTFAGRWRTDWEGEEQVSGSIPARTSREILSSYSRNALGS